MAFLDLLTAAAYTPEANYIKLLHQYKFNENTVHFFFEGLDDQTFYANYIENIFPDHFIFHYYVCDGKQNVYNQYADLNWGTYNKNRILFFTDKDLDDILGLTYPKDENIFETSFYSIENYLVQPDVFKRFLRENCYITDARIISDLIVQFNAQLEIFSKSMISISSWVIYCRKNSFRVNLSDIDISKIFELSSDFKVKKKVSSGHRNPFAYICDTTKTSHFDMYSIKEICTQLKGIHPPKVFIRGKYELWFLYAFCKNTVDITVPKINKEIKKYNLTNEVKITKCKVTIPIKPENIVQVLAPRVRMPNDISIFLNTNYGKITLA